MSSSEIDLLCAWLDPTSVHTIKNLNNLLIDTYGARTARLGLPNLVAHLRRLGYDIVGDNTNKRPHSETRHESINASNATHVKSTAGVHRSQARMAVSTSDTPRWTDSLKELYPSAEARRKLKWQDIENATLNEADTQAIEVRDKRDAIHEQVLENAETSTRQRLEETYGGLGQPGSKQRYAPYDKTKSSTSKTKKVVCPKATRANLGTR